MTSHPTDPKPKAKSGTDAQAWAPSKRMTDAERAMNDAFEEYERLRHAYRKVLAEELAASGLSQGRFAAHTPYTEESIRHIAREYGVTPKRKPTVKSIND